MGSTDHLTLRPLRTEDLPALMALVREAAWNQTEADWKWLLAHGEGIGFVDASDRVIASAVTLDYGGRLGWIGMVLVAGNERRKGLATRLLETCIGSLETRGLIPALDATPDGEAIYRKMGFEGEMTITRWRGAGTNEGPAFSDRLEQRDLPWISDLDARAFGAYRSGLLSTYLEPERPIGARRGRSAFLLERPGRTAPHIGPIVATDVFLADALFSEALKSHAGPLLIDAPDHQHGFAHRIADAGFAPERQFRRMYLGDQGAFEPQLLYAIAGPEIG